MSDRAIHDEEEAPLLRTPHEPHRSNKKKYITLTAAAGFALLVISGLLIFLWLQDKDIPNPDYQGHLVTGARAAVAVEVDVCSGTGVDVLKQGGNAVDAAIASALCIGVIDNFATGIGGGGFMLIRSPNGTFEFIDFRETAPAAAHRDMYNHDPDLAKYGGLAVGVPGEIRGFQLAHERHGKLSWAALFEPAIRIARDGFLTTRLLEERIKASLPWILESPEWAEVYAPNGTLAKAGDLIRRPALADTLEAIAIEGPDAFYTGRIAEHLVNTTRAAGGILTMEDMRSYEALIRPTVSTYYHGRKVTTCSTPTSGPMLISVLNILEQFNLRVEGLVGVNLHRLIESLKYGFAFRTEMGDPEFTKNQERLDQLVTKTWADRVRRNISDSTTHDPLYYRPKFDHVESHGTMHLSVVDEDDGAVALTSTVNLLFGARIMDSATGVILNDEMDDFSIPGKPNNFGLYPSAYNYVAPRKRPLSSITPTIVERNGAFEMALGASGGSMIPTATLTVLLNAIDFNKDLYDAVEAPRAHHQLMPNTVVIEDHWNDNALLEELKDRGHEIYRLLPQQRVTAVQAVRRQEDGTVTAASDPRKYGLAAAF